MSVEENRLSVKIDVDMSEFDKKIDVMEERLESLKREITSVSLSISSQIAALNAYAAEAKRKALSHAINSKTDSSDETKKILSEVDSKLNRQAAMISK